jgi:riboflavin synthase
MFTGLTQTLGTVRSIKEELEGRTLQIESPSFTSGPTIGESIAVNGACLTAITCEGDVFAFQAGPETLTKTNLGLLKPGDRVNLERALRVGDSLGGHFVTGHIDCTGVILEKRPVGEWLMIRFSYPPEFGDLMVPKGSIAVDGVSLTLVEVEASQFQVMLIPHTRDNTTLGLKQAGDTLNLEFDLLAKHVRKLVENMIALTPPPGGEGG